MAINEVQLIDHRKDPNSVERFIIPSSEAKQTEIILKLEELIASQGDIVIDTEAINLNTDEIEEKLDTLNSKVATETKQGTIITALGKLVGFEIPAYDYVSVVRSATSNVWTYKTGGSSGTTVGIITVNYSDSTKAYISSIVKS